MTGGPIAEKRPAWDPAAKPVKLKCAGRHVFGWVYPDGTVEVPCREKMCQRPGQEARHLFNPATGEHFTVYVAKPNSHRGLVAKSVTGSAAGATRQEGYDHAFR